MRQATLILNPQAGRQRKRAQLVPDLIQVFAEQDIVASAIETTGPCTAGALAASAVTDGVEMVFACGGDGTVHEVLQGLVGTQSALGIIPIGTANALARNIGLSRDPIRAAVQQARAEAIRISVGQVIYCSPPDCSTETRRYFTVMAGAGPDGALVYILLSAQKLAMGRAAYYAHAARLFVTRSFQPFRVLYRTSGSDIWQEETAVSVMSARIGDLGGVFGRLTRGSSLHAASLRLVLVRPPGRIGLPAWFVFGQLGMEQFNPWLRTLDVNEFRCEPASDESTIHAQIDGEWIGGLPISVRLLPDALSLLMPKRQLSKTGPLR